MSKEGLQFHRANKNPPGEWLVYTLLLERGLKRAFGGVYAHINRETLALAGRGRGGSGPVVFCMTHSGWFDGHLAALLNKRIFKHDAYLMMEEPNLARYAFFTWMGVFGVDRDDPRKALASIAYITDLLTEDEGRALWMFPQGTMRHPDARPLKLFGGVANIARRLDRCAIVPVAIRYDFMIDQAPYAFMRLGAPVRYSRAEGIGSRELTERLRIAMEAEADSLHADVSAYSREGYRRVLAGRGSVNKVWDGVLKIVGKVKSIMGARR